jgi:hypothetical protein
VGAARAAVDPVLVERDQCRNAKTQHLHERLMGKMPEALHRRLVSRMETTDWDPTSEEARLRSAERTA